MPFNAGTKLGPYEILIRIGAGAMGEVYKARDTRLNRTVAIKVLLQQVGGRPELQARFEREAQTIATLNHPHICTLHDVEDGVNYQKNAVAPHFSPDGRWIAYSSPESGHLEVYVTLFPGPGGKTQVSTDGGDEPVWSRNGRELSYINGDKTMAVDVETRPSFRTGSPHLLFTCRYQPSPNGVSGYDVSPDGKRFLKVQPTSPEQAGSQINVVINWLQELKQRQPAR